MADPGPLIWLLLPPEPLELAGPRAAPVTAPVSEPEQAGVSPLLLELAEALLGVAPAGEATREEFLGLGEGGGMLRSLGGGRFGLGEFACLTWEELLEEGQVFSSLPGLREGAVGSLPNNLVGALAKGEGVLLGEVTGEFFAEMRGEFLGEEMDAMRLETTGNP